MSDAGRRVEFAPAAQRQLRHLPPGDAARLRGPILALGIEPRPPGAVNLAETDFWRLRVGDLRVIYLVDDAASLVIVLKASRRSESTRRRRLGLLDINTDLDLASLDEIRRGAPGQAKGSRASIPSNRLKSRSRV